MSWFLYNWAIKLKNHFEKYKEKAIRIVPFAADRKHSGYDFRWDVSTQKFDSLKAQKKGYENKEEKRTINEDLMLVPMKQTVHRLQPHPRSQVLHISKRFPAQASPQKKN